MRILIQIKAVVVGTVLLFTTLVPACLVALPFGLERRLKIMSPMWECFGKLLLRYACQVKVRFSEDHRSPEFSGVPAQGLYIANHQSYMDIPLVMTKYQVPPIMKKEVLYIPIFGWIAYASGAMPVARGKMSSRKRVFDQARKRILVEKIGLQVYPEGTRSKNALPKTMEEVKRTLLIFAYNEKIPVIPTSIYGTRGVLNRWGFIRPNRNVGIIVHKEIDPKNFSNVDDFCVACWGKVIEGHDQMKKELQPLNENLS
ncbi:1-acyl-sn-glycerol-3-phosphate acyltransferase [Peredibacter sp. HCB2-198]|uniref:1-acyl-sn-glycerol-3-phosphate acyltransferase n=1 Tax=Peredibacter sp. HCB2-198 TaxID=3383025 RepID=UPI0038B69223